MKAIRNSLLGFGLGVACLVSACHRAPAPDQQIVKKDSASGPKLEGKDLMLRRGLEIKLVQNSLQGSKQERSLIIDNPSGAEGLSFTWSSGANSGAAPESYPHDDSAQNGGASGKMTLANTVDGRRMTFPLFWPGGELFMSNSSAIWLSDRAFSELKKDGKTQWTLGLLGNPLLGPAQGNDLIEASLEAINRSLDAKPEKLAEAQELKVTDDSADFSLKLNGVEREVDVIVAENWLARLKVLDNAQNPLILEVEVAPQNSAANLFSPLSWIRRWLNYRVTEISIRS